MKPTKPTKRVKQFRAKLANKRRQREETFAHEYLMSGLRSY